MNTGEPVLLMLKDIVNMKTFSGKDEEFQEWFFPLLETLRSEQLGWSGINRVAMGRACSRTVLYDDHGSPTCPAAA